MQNIQTGEIIGFYGRKVWIEGDFLGDKHVMLQHQDGSSPPFCYCTFHYDHRYTSNSGIYAASEAMAKALGATDPIESRFRDASHLFRHEPPLDAINQLYAQTVKFQIDLAKTRSSPDRPGRTADRSCVERRTAVGARLSTFNRVRDQVGRQLPHVSHGFRPHRRIVLTVGLADQVRELDVHAIRHIETR